MGKNRKIDDLEGIFEGQMKEEYFPVPLKGMGATFNFVQLHQNVWKNDNRKLVINSCYKKKKNGEGLFYLSALFNI